MGCGFGSAGGETAKVAVYDFGGGTFDATVVEVGPDRFEVLGSAGDRWLGGDDLDDALARHVADVFARETKIRLHNRREEFQRLLFACEEGKRLLSTLSKVEIIMPDAGRTEGGEQVLLVPVDRDDFDDVAHDVVSSSLVICQQALLEAGVEPGDLDALLVTGGTTRIPAVFGAATTFFDRSPMAGVHPEHAVVIGAAVRAAVISGEAIPADIGNRLRGYGVRGRDVGIAMADGRTEHVIRAESTPPIAAGRFFSATIEEGASYALELVEGPSEWAAENCPIGNFVIEGLPVGDDGTVVINIYFELGTTGTLYVTAQDRISGQRVQATFALADD
jgi:molecular chaperone DnaK